MKRSVVVLLALGIVIFIGLVIGFVAFVIIKQKNEAACDTLGCFDATLMILKNVDQDVDPCDNFYDFACGGYVALNSAPEGEISIDPFSVLRKNVDNQLREVIEEPSRYYEPKHFQLAKNLYKTCMDTSTIETAGLQPLFKILDRFGKWPVLEGGSWKEDNFTWVQSIYTAGKLGYSTSQFIALSVDVNWSDNKKYILELDQPTFGMAREFLMEGMDYFAVKAYYKYMVDIAVLLGANRQRASRELRQSLDFELKMVNITLSEEDRRNFTLLNNQMTISEIQRRYPTVNWLEYFNNILPSSVQVNADEVVTVIEPEFVSNLETLLRRTPKRIQANYMLWRIVAESIPYLSKNVRERVMVFESAMMGNVVKNNDPRWKQCLEAISESPLSLSVSALYVRRYFEENARQKVVEMVTDIRKELIKVLEKAEWMDETTRGKAITKAEAMLSHVAYPVELLDDNELAKIYSKIELRSNDFLGSMLSLNPLNSEFTFGLLRKPVNKTEWTTHEYSTEVNAFYDVTENSIQIPAAILQEPFFDSGRPRYMNYGAMGFLIGHEMTHSFDAEGRQFDRNGNLMDWWTPKTTQRYLQKAECMINQYNNYTVESVDMNVDGANTVSENMADNGGLHKAYLAYKEYVRRNGPEPKLPGLNYTQEQMFWISSASLWCIKYRPEAAHYELTTDVHSPERFRVIGPVSNLPEFAADFNCPVGSKMNPVHKCSVI